MQMREKERRKVIKLLHAYTMRFANKCEGMSGGGPDSSNLIERLWEIKRERERDWVILVKRERKWKRDIKKERKKIVLTHRESR